MKYRCFIALILICFINAATFAQVKQEPHKHQSSPPATPAQNNKQYVEEVKQAQAAADRFIKRLRETRDLTPLVDEMFAGDFKKLIREDTSWSYVVGVLPSLIENLKADERLRCYVLSFSLDYNLRLYEASKLSIESKDPTENVWSPEMLRFFRDNEPENINIKSLEEARKYLAFLERALAVVQKEVFKNPPEETVQFKKNLVLYGKYLQEYKWERPVVWMSERAEHGRPAGTLFAKVVIPFQMGLLMIKENGQYKIWLALATLPPPG